MFYINMTNERHQFRGGITIIKLSNLGNKSIFLPFSEYCKQLWQLNVLVFKKMPQIIQKDNVYFRYYNIGIKR